MKNIFTDTEKYFKQLIELEGDSTYLENATIEIEDEAETQKNIQRQSLANIKSPKNQPIQNMPKTSISPNWNQSTNLEELNQKIHNCQECPLGSTRNEFVFGTGNPNADIMIIGEAPGADEDKQGEPFVGRAGQLLTKILEAINLRREEVFIANIIKCRPPENRRPEKSEVEKCEPYLQKQIELIKPKFILSLGLTSVDTLLKKKHKMADIRGKVLDYQGIKMLVTYHPAALLRNPNWKKLTWQDVKLLRELYDKEM